MLTQKELLEKEHIIFSRSGKTITVSGAMKILLFLRGKFLSVEYLAMMKRANKKKAGRYDKHDISMAKKLIDIEQKIGMRITYDIDKDKLGAE